MVQGGYETTASALGFTIYNLAANPDKAAKLMKVPCPYQELPMIAPSQRHSCAAARVSCYLRGYLAVYWLHPLRCIPFQGGDLHLHECNCWH